MNIVLAQCSIVMIVLWLGFYAIGRLFWDHHKKTIAWVFWSGGITSFLLAIYVYTVCLHTLYRPS